MTGAIDVALLRTMPLPAPGEDKDQRGRVLIAGGNRAVPGAVLLSAEAAMRAGAGKLKIAMGRSTAPGLALCIPEALVMGRRKRRTATSARTPRRRWPNRRSAPTRCCSAPA